MPKSQVRHPHSIRANLHPPHVLALRLYTTAAFEAINVPLRLLSAAGDGCATPHPFPNVVRFLRDAILKLRTLNVPEKGSAQACSWLYRGFRDLQVSCIAEIMVLY